MSALGQLLQIVIQAVILLIFADAIISWIPSIPRYHPIVVLVRRLTHPILAPIRKIIPPQRMGDAYVDFTPIIAVLALMIISRYIVGGLLR